MPVEAVGKTEESVLAQMGLLKRAVEGLEWKKSGGHGDQLEHRKKSNDERVAGRMGKRARFEKYLNSVAKPRFSCSLIVSQ